MIGCLMPARPGKGWLLVPVLLLLIQEIPYFQNRWVEDESWYSIPAHTLLQEGRLRNPTFADTDAESRVDTRPPAMPLTLSLMFAALGTGVAPARLPSLLAGLGLVIVVYQLALELVGAWAAVLASILVATDNFLFLAARTARPEALVTFFCTLGFLLYLKSSRRSAAWLAFLSAGAIGVAMNYHVTAIPAALSLGVFLVCEFRSAQRRRMAWMAGLGLLLLILPFAAWVRSTPSHYAAFKTMYGQGETESTAEKLQAERTRYSDFLGLSSQRFHLPFRFPSRLPVVLAIAFSAAVLCRYNRKLLWPILVVLLGNLLGWVYLVNKTSRYFAIVAPALAILVAAAAATAWSRKRWGRPAACLLVFSMFSQLAGNLLLLYRARHANYQSVGAELRAIIPPNESVYGAITFWMALHDRKYCSFDRTPLAYAITERRPSFLIANDRVMTGGSGYGQDNFAGLRAAVTAFVQTHATLVGQVPDPFYGDLMIYRIHYQERARNRLP